MPLEGRRRAVRGHRAHVGRHVLVRYAVGDVDWLEISIFFAGLLTMHMICKRHCR